MKKIKLLSFAICLTALSTSANSQEPITLNYKVYADLNANSVQYNLYVISASFNNIIQLLFTDMSTYKATMNKYGYSIWENGGPYMAKTGLSLPYYSILKSTGKFSMMYTKDDGNISSFRTELKQKYNTIKVSFEDGYEVYRVLLKNDEAEYRLKIFLQEKEDGSSSLSILQN